MENIFMIPLGLTTPSSESWGIFFVGFGIVFTVLSLLVCFFYALPAMNNQIARYRLYNKYKHDRYVSQLERKKRKEEHKPLIMSAYENAAIAAALHMYFNEMHEDESNIITIKRIERRYNPWSSKIYGVRQ